MDRRGPAALAVMIALAALSLGPGAGRVRAAPSALALLPDLAVLAPFDLRIEVNDAGRRLLRFSTVIVNIGRGPLQLKGFDRGDGVAEPGDILSVRQQVREPDGSLARYDTSASMFWSGDGHDHWHISRIQDIRIQSLDDEVLGRVHKTGFCFLDSYPYGSDRPSRYDGEHSVCQTRPDGSVPMGVSVRWGDIYASDIAFQWINVTGLPDGRYRLKVIADPPSAGGGKLLESNETNNGGWAKIRIAGDSVTILKTSPRP